MNKQERETHLDKMVQLLPPEKREKWLELHSELERKIRLDHIKDSSEMDRHMEELNELTHEIDALFGLNSSGYEKRKKPIYPMFLCIGFLVFMTLIYLVSR